MRNGNELRRDISAALLGTLAFLIMLLVGVPILPSAPFLRYEPSGMIILLAVVLLGPGRGILACGIKDILFLLVGAGNIFGVTSDFLATASFALVAGVLIRNAGSLRGTLAGYVCGTIASTLVMIPANLIILNLEFHTPYQATLAMLLPVIIPFNLLKGGLNALAYHLLRKPVSRAAERQLG